MDILEEEKMLNKEKYKDELEKILGKVITVSKNGKIYQCRDIGKCSSDCIFFNGNDTNCVRKTIVWLNSEYKEPILTEEEREYLSAVIKPFRKKVKHIVKINLFSSPEEQFIRIVIGNLDFINLPNFNKNTGMYKGMEENKEYTCDELGL